MSEFKRAIDAAKSSMAYLTAQSRLMMKNAKDRHLDVLISKLKEAEPECSMYIGTYSVGINVPVKSMKHMMEVIEFAEKIIGFELDASDDSAEYGQRTFYNKKYDNQWLRIIAKVPLTDEPEDQLCRRVQVGVKTVEVPEYKLECSDPV